MIAWPVRAPQADVARRAGVHRSPHTEHSEVLVGAKLGYLGLTADDGRIENGWGVQGFFETTVLHGVVEVELAVASFFVADEVEVPFDVVLKKPLHLADWLTPYVGIGATAALIVEEREPGVRELDGAVGGMAVAGAYIWWSEHVGIDVEVDYTLATRGTMFQEIIVASGPTLRF